MLVGKLYTIDPNYGSFTLRAVRLTEDYKWFETTGHVKSFDPGDWFLLIEQFTYPPGHSLKHNVSYYIFFRDEKLWLYELGASSQRFFIDKEEWDNPGYD